MSCRSLRGLGPILFTFLFVILEARPAVSQTGGVYDLSWNTIDGGGGSASGGAYSLGATAGQPDAGSASGGAYSLTGGFWTIASQAAPPAVVSAVSRKTHGKSGIFDIPLPLTGTPGVECRSGGGGRNHQVVVTFASPVTVGGVGVTSSDGTATGTQTVSGANVTINLASIANAQIVGITLTNVNDGANVGDVAIPFRVLVGDTTNNGSVSASDIGQVKGQSGQAVTSSNFRADVTANGGSITASDIGLVKSVSGTQLP